MKLHFPDGKGGVNTIEVSDNISLYIENLLEDWTLETASESIKGGIKIGDGLYMTGDSLNAKQYTLFPASKDNLGGVIVGDGLNIDSDGVISADVYELPIATTENLGGVIIGDGLTIDSAGVVSTDVYDLPTASETVKGGIMVGNGLYMDGDSLNVSVSGGGDTYYTIEGGEGVVSLQPVYVENPYELPIANKTRLGGIKVGNGLEINSISGVLSAKLQELPIATRGSLGVIIVGSGLEVDEDGVVDVTLPHASRTKLGAIKVGDGLAMIGDSLNVTIQPENNYYYDVADGTEIISLQPVLLENPYVLPPATRENLGGVIIGNGLTIDSGGVVSAKTYTLPTASETVKGGVKIGSGLTMTGESLNADGYDLPTASNVTKGGIKVGAGLYMRGDSLNASSSSPATYTLPTATKYVKGGIKVGKGLYMNGDSLNADFDSEYELPIATRERLGGVIIGDGLDITEDGILSCNISESTVASMVAEATGESGEYVGKGTTVVILAYDQDFDFSGREWYCYYRSAYNYEVIHPLPSGTPYISATDTGSGEFVLPAEYMGLDFVVRGDNNKLVSEFGTLYNESEAKYHRNLATKKQFKDSKCVVPFDAQILNNALSQGKIVAEYGIVSEMGNVVFKGTVSTLPESPKHGWLCYNSTDNKFHGYDGTANKWRSWLCTV